jgi:uncharacterized protein
MVWLLGGYGFICLLLYVFQEKMIFPGQALPEDYEFRFASGVRGEDVWMENEAARLHGLFFRAKAPQGALLYFHGNGGDLSEWGDIAPDLVSRGYHVLMVDYRGYGKSVGARTQATLLADALIAYDSLRAAVSSTLPVAVFGRSLGTGLASYVASQRPVDRLLLETPYRSLAGVAQGRFPWLPVRWLMRFPMSTETFLQEVSVPVYLIHGTSDQTIPVSHSRYLEQRLPPEQGHYVEIPGGHHNDLEEYPAYQAWLDQALLSE